jgi:hypothetical protein
MIPLFCRALGFANPTSKSTLKSFPSMLEEVRFFQLLKSTPVLRGKGQKVSYSPLSIYLSARSLAFGDSSVYTSFKYLLDNIPQRKTLPFKGEGPGGESYFLKAFN